MTSSVSKFRFAVLAAVLVTGANLAIASPILPPPLPPTTGGMAVATASPVLPPPLPPTTGGMAV